MDDPLVRCICVAWDGINEMSKAIKRLKNQLPQPYRPLVEPTKTSGLAERELPWAGEQRRADDKVRAARKPEPPTQR